MKHLTSLGAAAVLGTALACGAACDSQTGENYQGEALLSIQGSVITNSALTSDMVPVLAFGANGMTSLHFTDGNVSGNFPAKFSFAVTEPPPDSALFEEFRYPNGAPPRGKLAKGMLVMLEPNYPQTVEACADAGTTISGSGGPEGPSTQYIDRSVCSSDDRRLERHFECEPLACPMVSSTGTPPLVKDDYAISSRVRRCFGSTCITSFDYQTDPSAAKPEYREVFRCETPEDAEDSLLGSSNYVFDCAVTSQTGDSSLAAFDALKTVASTFEIWFATESEPEFPYGELTPGYNIVMFDDVSAEQLVSWVGCLSDAMASAMAEFRAMHDTFELSLDEYSCLTCTSSDDETACSTCSEETSTEYFSLVAKQKSECDDPRHPRVLPNAEAKGVSIRIGEPLSSN